MLHVIDNMLLVIPVTGVLGVLLESGALPAASTGTTAAAQAGTEAAAALDAANVLLANDASLSSSSLQQQQQLGALGAPAWMATVEDVADRKAFSAHTPPAAGGYSKAEAGEWGRVSSTACCTPLQVGGLVQHTTLRICHALTLLPW